MLSDKLFKDLDEKRQFVRDTLIARGEWK